MNYQSNRPDIAQAGPVQWLAIGIQPQWGIVYAEQGYIIVTLPLAYSSNKLRYVFRLREVVICPIAQQGFKTQWGMISNNKAVFPIAFTAFCSAATLFIRGSGTGTWYGDNANVTLTGLSCITPDYVLNGNFIVIGV